MTGVAARLRELYDAAYRLDPAEVGTDHLAAWAEEYGDAMLAVVEAAEERKIYGCDCPSCLALASLEARLAAVSRGQT